VLTDGRSPRVASCLPSCVHPARGDPGPGSARIASAIRKIGGMKRRSPGVLPGPAAPESRSRRVLRHVHGRRAWERMAREE
jgi:hypothetical protein